MTEVPVTPIKPQEGSASIVYVRALLDYLHAAGLDPIELLGPSLSTELALAGRRIPVSRWLAMFEQAIARTGDPDLPLKVAEHIQPRHLGMLGFAAMSSRTLGDVIAILLRYERLVDDVNETRLVKRDDRIELHWLPLSGPASPVFMQLSLAAWAVLARQLTHQPGIECEAHFSFTRPANLEVYQRIFGGRLFFDQAITKLVHHQSVLSLPISFSDPDTHSVLIAQAEADLQSISQPDFLRVLREYLAMHLASGTLSLADTASGFGVSPRTLQYRLSTYGIGYRGLLDEIRLKHARRHLDNAELSLSEIAFLLGYSEQSAFHHAFKRWTGTSPGDFRKQAQP